MASQKYDGFSSSSFKEQWFSFHGRLNRQRYIWRSLLMAALNFLVSGGAHESGMLYLLFISIPLLWISFSLITRRSHDIDRPGWIFIILCLIPLVNIFAGLYLWCKKGTNGPNRFGPDPLG